MTPFITNTNDNDDIVISTDDGSGMTAKITSGDDGRLYHGDILRITLVSHFYGNQKLATKSTGIEVTGLTDTDTLTTGNTIFI